MTIEITRRDFLRTAASTAVIAVAGPGQLIRPQALRAAAIPQRQPDGGFIYHPPMSSGIPLGGMGAGTFEIRADGRTYEWQVFNNWASTMSLPDTFFAIQTSGGGQASIARRLETATDKTLPGMPVEQIAFEGQFPFARLTYEDAELPVHIGLTAWSPFIPHHPRESGLPAAIFTFSVTNRTAHPVQASVLASIRNGVGLHHSGTHNVLQRSPSLTAIRMEPTGHASLPTVSRPVHVLVLMEGSDDRNNLRDAMAGVPGLTYDWPDVDNVTGSITLPATTAAELKQKYDAVWIGEIAHSRDTLGDANMAMIRDAVQIGMGLLVIGGWDAFYGHDAGRWAHLNGTPLEEALPVTFSAEFDGVDGPTFAHTVAPAPFPAAPPTDLQFGGYSKVASVKPGAHVLLKADDGTPLLITGTFGQGRTAVWASGAIGGWAPADWNKAEFFLSITSWLAGAAYTPGLGIPLLDPAYGTMTLAALTPHAAAATEWSDANRLWQEFAAHGTVSSQTVAPDRHRNGALTQVLALAPHETKSVTYVLAWHFPNHFDTTPDRNWLGHQYAHWYSNSDEVVQDVIANHPAWHAQSKAFQESLYASTLPPKVADAINAQMTTFAKETWWVEDGTWAVWEGMGCCGLQTLDVGFYGSVPIALFFPEQERMAMRISAQHQNPAGKMPHFFPGNFVKPDAWDKIDLMPKFALMAYRDYLWSGDLDYLKEMWPVIKRAMAYDQGTDANKDWLPDDHGADETYDGWSMEGSTSYVCSIWLAGLAACIRMAEILGDDTTRADYAHWLEEGQKSFDTELWNGKFYQMSRDIANGHQSTGIMLAGMIGQWKAHLCDLGYVFPPDKVRQHLLAAYQYCRQATRPGMPYVNPNDGIAYVNGNWPDGSGPKGEGQWSGPWTGVEYMYASGLGYEGLPEQAVTVASDVYDRYAQRLAPWDHIECGEHYYRPMSVWAVLLGLQGFRWDATAQSLGFTPQVSPLNHRSVFCTAAGWGDYTAQTSAGQRRHSLALRAGTLPLRELTFGVTPHEGARPGAGLSVRYEGRLIAATGHLAGDRLTVALAQPLVVSPGETLTVAWAA
jgi:uncharacterized protein (DUF608 family)